MTTTQYADRVWEVGTVSGTGTLNLPNSAQTGCITFATGLTSGNLTVYCIYDTVAYAWEVGIGTYTSGSPGTLSRTTILASTNSGSAVSFAGNSCNITVVVPAPVQTSSGSGSAGLVPALNPNGYIDPSMLGVGYGFSNMVVQTSGSSATWNLPSQLQTAGAQFKVTIIGGGGQGGGTSTTAGQCGGGGGSGGVVVVYLSYVSGQNTGTYTIGAGGSTSGTNATGQAGGNSTFIYNSVTYTAGGGGGGLIYSTGTGGAGGTASGGTLNLPGGLGGSGGTMAATNNHACWGAATPLGYGEGAPMPATAAGATGNAATGYGAGGSGGRNGTGTTARAGGAGTGGLVIIEY